MFQPAPQRGLPVRRIAHQHNFRLMQGLTVGSHSGKEADDRLSVLAENLHGRISEWVSVECYSSKRGQAADGLGQGRELVVVEREALQRGEAADGLGQGRELVVVSRGLQLARPPMDSGRAASWLS